MYSEHPKKLALTLILQYKVKTNYYLTTLASLFFFKGLFSRSCCCFQSSGWCSV